MNAYLAVLLLYSGSLIAIGLWLGRRVKETGDFFVAGRSLGPLLVFATILAANIGAGSTVAATGFGFQDGLGAWWVVGSAGIGSLLLAFWVGPRVRRLAADHGFLTVGDLLEFRYGKAARGVVAVLLWIGTVAILAGQFVALHKHLSVVTALPKFGSVLLGGAVVTIYFSAGGLKGAAWIHLMQLVVLLTAFIIAVPMVWTAAGGWDGISAAADTPTFTSFWGNSRTGLILLPLLLPNFVISPGLVQKVYGARDDAAVRIGVGAAAVVLLIFAFAPTILGMSANVLHPEITDRDTALTILMVENLPLFVGAIGVGAIFMAEISTSDAILFMLSTAWSQDIYRRFIRPTASDKEVLKAARWAAIGGGVMAMAVAMFSETIFGPLKFFYSIVAVMLFVPVIAGLYTGKAGRREAFSSFAAGIGVLILMKVAGFADGPASLAGVLASGVAFGSTWLLAGRRNA